MRAASNSRWSGCADTISIEALLQSKAAYDERAGTNLDVEAADDILMSSRWVGTKRMPRASRGSATMIATRRETAGGSAGSDNAAALGAADWLCLAAAPTFAIMALVTGVPGGGPPDMFCSAAHDASPPSGMVLMYVLMSAFHSAPWLKLIRTKSFDQWIAHALKPTREEI